MGRSRILLQYYLQYLRHALAKCLPCISKRLVTDKKILFGRTSDRRVVCNIAGLPWDLVNIDADLSLMSGVLKPRDIVRQTFTIACGMAAPGKAFPPLPPFAPEAVPINKLTRLVRLAAETGHPSKVRDKAKVPQSLSFTAIASSGGLEQNWDQHHNLYVQKYIA